MTKGTLIFRIVISVLLVATVLLAGFTAVGLMFYAKNYVHQSGFGFFVNGIEVTRENMNDVFGDGTVWYTSGDNMLHFKNANIVCDNAAIYSKVDLHVELIGENRFLCKDQSRVFSIYAANYDLAKDLVIMGDGSLTIDYENVTDSAMGIFAEDLSVLSNITVNAPSCTEMSYGIVCTSSMRVEDGAGITINNGSAKHTVGINVRGNLIVHEDAVINVTSAPGAAETGRGLALDGDLILRNRATVNVSIDDENVVLGECIRVNGVIDADPDAKITASSQKAAAIECLGSVRLNKGVTITANTDGEGADFMCYGAIVHYGAIINGEVEAVCGVQSKE